MTFRIKKARIQQIIKEENQRLQYEGEYDNSPDDDVSGMSIQDIAKLVQQQKQFEQQFGQTAVALYSVAQDMANNRMKQLVAKGNPNAQKLADAERVKIFSDLASDIEALGRGEKINTGAI